MKKKNVFMLAGALSLIVVVFSSLVYANEDSTVKQFISNFFYHVKHEIDIREDGIVAKLNDIEITEERYIFYKRNVEMIQKIEGTNDKIDDIELINEMIGKDLTVQYAENMGITADPDEVDKVVEFQRNLLNDPSVTGPNNELVKEIMKNRIRITGLSEDEFWKSDEIRDQYRESVIISHLFDQLSQNGEVQDMNDFSEFQDNLIDQKKEQIEIMTPNIKE